MRLCVYGLITGGYYPQIRVVLLVLVGLNTQGTIRFVCHIELNKEKGGVFAQQLCILWPVAAAGCLPSYKHASTGIVWLAEIIAVLIVYIKSDRAL